MSTRFRMILTISIIVLVLALGVAGTLLILHNGRLLNASRLENVSLRKQLGVLQMTHLTIQEQQMQPQPSSDAITSEQKEPDLSHISVTSSAALKEQILIPLESIQVIRELSPGLLVVVVEKRIRNGTDTVSGAWLLDFNNIEFRRLTEPVWDGCGSTSLSGWLDGARIKTSASPCEAVQSTDEIFLDRNGTVVARTSSGNYNRSGDQIGALIAGKNFSIQLMQSEGSCIEKTGGNIYDEKTGWLHVPTTTLLGLTVNGRLFPLPPHSIAECYVGYGDSIGAVELPAPEFDGQKMTFHIPGYDVAMSTNGTVTYAKASIFYIEQIKEGEQQLLEENSQGVHVLMQNIFTDPTISDFPRSVDLYSRGVSGSSAHFLIRFINKEQHQSNDFGTVDYNIQTRRFENLVPVEKQ